MNINEYNISMDISECSAASMGYEAPKMGYNWDKVAPQI